MDLRGPNFCVSSLLSIPYPRYVNAHSHRIQPAIKSTHPRAFLSSLPPLVMKYRPISGSAIAPRIRKMIHPGRLSESFLLLIYSPPSNGFIHRNIGFQRYDSIPEIPYGRCFGDFLSVSLELCQAHYPYVWTMSLAFFHLVFTDQCS